MPERIANIDVDNLASELGVGKLLLEDILASLARPGRDPREDLTPPTFRREVIKLEDLKPGMELTGTVLNVVDFGAFVDIGLTDSGLIHVSRLSDQFVTDPHEVVCVGDIVTVWVVDVDEKRRRVSLTAIKPGTEKARPMHRGKSGQKGGGAARGSQGDRQHVRKERGKSHQGRGRGRSDNRKKQTGWKPKPKPKPIVPITDAMADGSEPMRTFSDLQQFFEKKKKTGKATDDSDKKDQ